MDATADQAKLQAIFNTDLEGTLNTSVKFNL